MMNIVVALPSSCAKEFRGYSKIDKHVERRRDRERSRLPKKIIRSMKKRKVRCKLKCFLRKCIFLNRPDCMYGLVTYYNLWYGSKHICTNVNIFFSNFLKLKSANKLLQNNKRITSSCLNNHKITKSTSRTKRESLKNEAFADIW